MRSSRDALRCKLLHCCRPRSPPAHVRFVRRHAPQCGEESKLVQPSGDEVEVIQKNTTALPAQPAEVHHQPPVDEQPRIVGGAHGDVGSGSVLKRRLQPDAAV